MCTILKLESRLIFENKRSSEPCPGNRYTRVVSGAANVSIMLNNKSKVKSLIYPVNVNAFDLVLFYIQALQACERLLVFAVIRVQVLRTWWIVLLLPLFTFKSSGLGGLCCCCCYLCCYCCYSCSSPSDLEALFYRYLLNPEGVKCA